VTRRKRRLPPRWFIETFWRVHRRIVATSGGRRGLWAPRPAKWGALRLTTTGRRSGKPRSVILGYYEDGPNLVSMAMNGWGAAEPAWWLNLQSQPHAIVDLAGGARREVVGRVCERGAVQYSSGLIMRPSLNGIPHLLEFSTDLFDHLVPAFHATLAKNLQCMEVVTGLPSPCCADTLRQLPGRVTKGTGTSIQCNGLSQTWGPFPGPSVSFRDRRCPPEMKTRIGMSRIRVPEGGHTLDMIGADPGMVPVSLGKVLEGLFGRASILTTILPLGPGREITPALSVTDYPVRSGLSFRCLANTSAFFRSSALGRPLFSPPKYFKKLFVFHPGQPNSPETA
jgi:deazaflavin-dependent oxidoreductase (nitroreductase family)